MKSLAVLLVFSLVTPAMAQPASPTISRSDAIAAANAIGAIGEYKCPGTGPGQQPVVDCFMKVPIATRSALAHDMTILMVIAKETQAAAPPGASAADLAKLGEQRVPVNGLIKFTEADLDLADNPQITPMLEAALAPLMK